ncbi:MAG TPA: hypothetical protein VD906_05570 [Caulobacteraceae bacterium]|nr:hypothetical protein [Caulobacteraceae bacterium]
MKLRTLALAATFALSAAPALAAGSVSATLQSPVAKAKVVAGGAVFNCADTTCIAVTPTERTLTAAACKQLVKEVGALSAFGSDKRQLDVARCNGAAPAATATGAN